MAAAKLPLHYSCRALILGLGITALTACTGFSGKEPSVGMTLEFMNWGKDYLVVKQFDPDGLRGPVPGALGPSRTEGKQMSFMPGDSARGMPTFVDVQWVIPNKEFLQWADEVESKPPQARYTKEVRAISERLWKANPSYTQRVDLTPIITPELVTRVRADRQNTQLKLTIIFNNDQVSIEAEARKWR
jgi:hypothetical protein